MHIRHLLLNFMRSPWGLLVIALLVAAGLSFVIFEYLRDREQRIKEEVIAQTNSQEHMPTVSVVVPRGDVGAGSVINSENFAARAVAEDLVYEDTIQASDFEHFSGQKLARPVLRGRPVRFSDLMAPEIKDVALVVPNGMRAVTIPIDNLNSISQTLRAGNAVDIFLLSRAPKLQDDLPDEALDQASLFMQNMEVLAVGRDFTDTRHHSDIADSMVRPGEVQGTEGPSYETATLLVTPAQAAKLLIGQKLGNFRLVLRGREDIKTIELATLSAGSFLPAPPPQPIQPPGVQYIVGGSGSSADMVATRMPATAPSAAATSSAPAINPLSNEALERAIANITQAGRSSGAAQRRGISTEGVLP